MINTVNDASVCEVSRAQHQQQSSGLSLSQVVQKDDDQHTDIPDPNDSIERIRRLYEIREQRLLPVPWCDDTSFSLKEIFTKLRIVRRDKTTGKKAKVVITNITGIYEKPKNRKEPPRTVLIEGDSGMGKTTYCQKLAYDWATSREHWDKSFPMISLLILLRCHDIKSNLWEAIDEQLLPDDIDEECKQNLFKFIRENQSKVLIVLDGLDEADHGAIDVFIKLAQSEELPECLFVFTARHESGVKMRRYCDNLWEIAGFTEEDAKEFIYKYSKNMGHLAEGLLEEIGSRPDLRKLISNPLNTALLCILCKDFKEGFPESRSQLYIEIVKCVLRRYEEKEGFSSNNEDIIDVYKEELRSLGNIALKSLLKGELYIDKRRVNANNFKSANKFGFLSIQSRGSKGKPCFRYGFLHKSFQEFFAGFHLALSNPGKAKIKITDKKFLYELHEVFLYICGVVVMQGEKNAKRLLRDITIHLNRLKSNFKEIVGDIKLAFSLIEECGKCMKSLQSQLLHEFGAHLKLKVCTLGMIPRLDFFLESLSSNTSLTNLDLHLGFLTFGCAKIDNEEIALLSRALSVNTTLTHLNLSDNEIGASGARSLSDALSSNTTSKLAHLNLSNNEIGASGARSLSEALSGNTTLTHLNLSNNKIDVSGARSLSEALSGNTTLTHLNLSDNVIDASGATFLSEAFSGQTALTHLNLSANEIGTSGARSLSEVLSGNMKLTHLNLSNNKIDTSGARSLSEALSVNTALTRLNLDGNSVGAFGARYLSLALRNNTTLTHSNLGGNLVGAASRSQALSGNTTLTDLNLSSNKIYDLNGASLFQALLDNTTLTHLNLSDNMIDWNLVDYSGVSPLFSALSNNTALTHLNLSGSNIDHDGVCFLFAALLNNTTLTDLNLSYNEIPTRGSHSPFEALSYNTTLTNLNLSNNEINVIHVECLSRALSVNTTLTNLNLSNNNIDDSHVDCLSGALSVNTTLTHLNLSYNKIGFEGARYLYFAFVRQSKLTHLNLSHNSISFGVEYLSYALQFTGAKLSHLNLSYNYIDTQDIKSFSGALSFNAKLTHLNLSGNDIGDSGAASLSQALSTNTKLIYLNLSRSKIGASGAASLFQVLSVNSSLTCLDLHLNEIADPELLLSLRPFQSTYILP